MINDSTRAVDPSLPRNRAPGTCLGERYLVPRSVQLTDTETRLSVCFTPCAEDAIGPDQAACKLCAALRGRGEADPDIVDGGMALQHRPVYRIARIGREEDAIDAGTLVFREDFGEGDLDAERTAEREAIDTEHQRVETRRIPVVDLIVRAEALVVAIDQCACIGDDIEAVVRAILPRQTMGAADHHPQTKLARRRRDRRKPLANGRPIEGPPVSDFRS